MHVNQPTNMIYYALGRWLQGSSSEKKKPLQEKEAVK